MLNSFNCLGLGQWRLVAGVVGLGDLALFVFWIARSSCVAAYLILVVCCAVVVG